MMNMTQMKHHCRCTSVRQAYFFEGKLNKNSEMNHVTRTSHHKTSSSETTRTACCWGRKLPPTGRKKVKLACFPSGSGSTDDNSCFKKPGNDYDERTQLSLLNLTREVGIPFQCSGTKGLILCTSKYAPAV
jgi:hypothetical protein